MALTDWASIHGDTFSGKRALVTGGAGFIGSHLSEALIDMGADIRCNEILVAIGRESARLGCAFTGRETEVAELHAAVRAGPRRQREYVCRRRRQDRSSQSRRGN